MKIVGDGLWVGENLLVGTYLTLILGAGSRTTKSAEMPLPTRAIADVTAIRIMMRNKMTCPCY